MAPNTPNSSIENSEKSKKIDNNQMQRYLARDYVLSVSEDQWQDWLVDILWSKELSGAQRRALAKYAKENPKYAQTTLEWFENAYLRNEAESLLKKSSIENTLQNRIELQFSNSFSSNNAEAKKQKESIWKALWKSAYNQLVILSKNSIELAKFSDWILDSPRNYQNIAQKLSSASEALDKIVVNASDYSDLRDAAANKNAWAIVEYLTTKWVSKNVKLKALKELWVDVSYSQALDFWILTNEQVRSQIKSLNWWIDDEAAEELTRDSDFLDWMTYWVSLNTLNDEQLNQLLADKIVEAYQDDATRKEIVDDLELATNNLETIAQNISNWTWKRLDGWDFVVWNYIVFNNNKSSDSIKDIWGAIRITAYDDGSQPWEESIEIEYVTQGGVILAAGDRKKERLRTDKFQKLLINSVTAGDFDIAYWASKKSFSQSLNDLGYGRTHEVLSTENSIAELQKSLDLLDPAGSKFTLSSENLPFWVEYTGENGQKQNFQVDEVSNSNKTLTVYGAWVWFQKLTFQEFLHPFSKIGAKRFELIKTPDTLLTKLQDLKSVGKTFWEYKVNDSAKNKFVTEVSDGAKRTTTQLQYLYDPDKNLAVEIVSIDNDKVIYKTGTLKPNPNEGDGAEKKPKYVWSFSKGTAVGGLDDFLSIVENNNFEAVNDLWDTVKIVESEKKADEWIDVIRSLRDKWLGMWSLQDIMAGWNKLKEHIEWKLKDSAYFKSEKVAYSMSKTLGLWEDYRIKLEWRITSKIDEIKDDLKSVSAPARNKRITDMMKNTSTSREERIAALLAMLEKYGDLNAKWFQKYPAWKWYEFFGWTVDDEYWMDEVERSKDEWVPFDETQPITNILQSWWKDARTWTNIYKKVEGARSAGIQKTLGDWKTVADSKQTGSWKRSMFINEFDWNSGWDVVWILKASLPSWAFQTPKDLGFFSNMLILTGAIERYPEQILKEMDWIAYTSSLPSYFFSNNAKNAKLYKETINAALGKKYGDTLKKLSDPNLELKKKTVLFKTFWADHGQEVTDVMNMSWDYTIFKNKDEEPYKSYLKHIEANTPDMSWVIWQSASTPAAVIAEWEWVNTYGYDLFSNIQFDSNGSLNKNTKADLVFKWILKQSYKIAENSELSSQQKAELLAPIALKLNKALMERWWERIEETFYNNSAFWPRLEALWFIRIKSSSADASTVMESEYTNVYENIYQTMKTRSFNSHDIQETRENERAGKVVTDTEKLVASLMSEDTAGNTLWNNPKPLTRVDRAELEEEFA